MYPSQEALKSNTCTRYLGMMLLMSANNRRVLDVVMGASATLFCTILATAKRCAAHEFFFFFFFSPREGITLGNSETRKIKKRRLYQKIFASLFRETISPFRLHGIERHERHTWRRWRHVYRAPLYMEFSSRGCEESFGTATIHDFRCPMLTDY